MARWWLMSWGEEHMDGTGLFGCLRILFIPWMALKRFGFLRLRCQTSISGNLEAWQGLGCMSRDASCKVALKPSCELKINNPNSPPLHMR